MWGLILYVLAVAVGLGLFFFYEPSKECEQDHTERERSHLQRSPASETSFSSILTTLGISFEEDHVPFTPVHSSYTSIEAVTNACHEAGLKNCKLVIGIDFTASNEWQGRKTFYQNSLHKLSANKIYNPYQKVIWILGQALVPFAKDNRIPAYGFGSAETTDESVFNIKSEDEMCNGFDDVLKCYCEVVRHVTLSGPTSFAPIIYKTIEHVKKLRTYHILLIVADGQVSRDEPTVTAIVEASSHPISILVVGVGDGPWNIMDAFVHQLPKRKFDNFHFVDYHKATSKVKNADTAFALSALTHIPHQFRSIKRLGYLDDGDSISESLSESSVGYCEVGDATGDLMDCSALSPIEPRNQSVHRRTNAATYSTPV